MFGVGTLAIVVAPFLSIFWVKLSLVLLGGGFLIFGLWQHFKSVEWNIICFYIACPFIVVGLALLVINDYPTSKENNEPEQETLVLKLTPKQIESKVEDWLTDYGFSVRKFQDEEAHFCFGVVNKIGQKTIIKLPKSPETLLILYGKITPKSKDIEAINKLKKTNKTSIKIKTYLDNKDLSYTLDPQLKKIEIEEVLFVESLTQPNFFKALKRISSGQTMIATYIHEVLNP